MHTPTCLELVLTLSSSSLFQDIHVGAQNSHTNGKSDNVLPKAWPHQRRENNGKISDEKMLKLPTRNEQEIA